jgi:hypothetical protein
MQVRTRMHVHAAHLVVLSLQLHQESTQWLTTCRDGCNTLGACPAAESGDTYIELGYLLIRVRRAVNAGSWRCPSTAPLICATPPSIESGVPMLPHAVYLRVGMSDHPDASACVSL